MPAPPAGTAIFASASWPRHSAALPPVARHRLVYAAVDDMLKTDIHALAIEALAAGRAECAADFYGQNASIIGEIAR